MFAVLKQQKTIIMTQSVRILKNLVGEFVTPNEVKEASQKDYNQSIWENTVDRYLKYDEVRFFKTTGTHYEFDYYVIYLIEGIRFLGLVSYGSSLTNGGFAFGFFTEGMKDKEMVAKLVKEVPELKGIENDSLTILTHNEGRISTGHKARNWMKTESASLNTRFFTKEF
jgi:hypothetical protein